MAKMLARGSLHGGSVATGYLVSHVNSIPMPSGGIPLRRQVVGLGLAVLNANEEEGLRMTRSLAYRLAT